MPEADWNRRVQCPGRDSGEENLRSLTAWTERSGVKAVRRVVRDLGANHSRGPDLTLEFRLYLHVIIFEWG
jgi:hypothetical protein